MKGRTLLNNRKARVTTLAATGAATVAAGLVGTASPAQANGVWDRLAQCESGGNWQINTGNGFYGGLQFTLSTWQGFGGSGMPHHASKAEQIRIAQRVLQGQGPGAWPVCSKRAGLTASNGGATSAQPQQEQPQQREQAPQQEQPQQREQAPQQEQPQQEAPKQEQPAQPEQAPQQEAPKQEQPQQEQAPQQERSSRSSERAQAPTPQQTVPQTNFGTPPSVKASEQTFKVEKGDTLSKLAAKHEVTDWRTLWGANAKSVDNPNLIFVGQTLHLPA